MHALQCCKIKWNEENLGLCFQMKLNCSKVDKIIYNAFFVVYNRTNATILSFRSLTTILFGICIF